MCERPVPADDHNGAPPRPHLVVVSNRGPVQFTRAHDVRVSDRGAGGLVSALSSLPALGVSGVWVCSAMTDEDAAVAAENRGESFALPDYADGKMRVRLVSHEPGAFASAHHGFSNSLLWFLQHQLWGWGTDPEVGPAGYRAFDDGYRVVNKTFADAAIDEASRADGDVVVMIHDYHLYLVGAMVREALPDAMIQHFVHIPWPPPDAWGALPRRMVAAILEGLLGCTVVAFQTERYARNFMRTCAEILGTPVDYSKRTVAVQERQVRISWYPISVDQASIMSQLAAPEVAAERTAIAAVRRDKLIVRVDRADPSKNIVRGFHAYELMLERHPELHGDVSFLALIQPSRSNLHVYADYLEKIEQAAEQINDRFGTRQWLPVDLKIAESLPRALAAFQEFDVLFVNPVADGLNLVAKEGVLINDRDGVLVISEPAGVFEEIGSFAIAVNPFDTLGQADALHAALTMSRSERHERASACREVVARNDLNRWLGEQLRDLTDQRRPSLSLLRSAIPSRTRSAGRRRP